MEFRLMNKIIKEEGDFYSFKHCNLKCQILRSYLRFWCGYILFDSRYVFDVNKIEVHWGITFNKVIEVQGCKKRKIGFDCGHSGDLVPYFLLPPSSSLIFSSDVYRNKEFAINETKGMATQVSEFIKRQEQSGGVQ